MPGTPRRSAIARQCSARRPHSATTSARGCDWNPGTWQVSAKLPAPMTPKRSFGLAMLHHLQIPTPLRREDEAFPAFGKALEVLILAQGERLGVAARIPRRVADAQGVGAGFGRDL